MGCKLVLNLYPKGKEEHKPLYKIDKEYPEVIGGSREYIPATGDRILKVV